MLVGEGKLLKDCYNFEMVGSRSCYYFRFEEIRESNGQWNWERERIMWIEILD